MLFNDSNLYLSPYGIGICCVVAMLCVCPAGEPTARIHSYYFSCLCMVAGAAWRCGSNHCFFHITCDLRWEPIAWLFFAVSWLCSVAYFPSGYGVNTSYWNNLYCRHLHEYVPNTTTLQTIIAQGRCQAHWLPFIGSLAVLGIANLIVTHFESPKQVTPWSGALGHAVFSVWGLGAMEWPCVSC